MNLIKFIKHPYTVIISFFAIIISGQHLGGFYLLYLLLALPHLGIHSVFAFLGVALLLVSHKRFNESKGYVAGHVTNLIGLLLLLLSLFTFFHNDKEHYNYGTFSQLVPQITLFIFIVLAILFLLENLVALFKNFRQTNMEG